MEINDKVLIAEANKLFVKGAYAEARLLYEKARRSYGLPGLEFNIELCNKRDHDRSVSKKLAANGSRVNEYFEHVYVVNLESAIEDRLKVSSHLISKGIQFELFTAINGYEGAAYDIWREYDKKPLGALTKLSDLNIREIKRNKKFIESPGAIGYILTYIEILKDAKAKGYRNFLILEDDVILVDNFETRFEKFMESVGESWKIIQLGASQYSWEGIDEVEAVKNGYYFPLRMHTCGSFAIGVDQSVIDELIDIESALEVPFDHASVGTLYKKYTEQCYVAYPNLVMPDVGTSSIRGGRDQYVHGERMRWQVDAYPYPLPSPSLSLLIRNRENFRYLTPLVTKGMPFDLRVYYMSNDGLRPVHDISSIPSGKLPVDDMHSIRFPATDYYAVVTDDFPVSERDLISFMEAKISQKNGDVGNISSFSGLGKLKKKGRVSTIIPTYKRPTNLRAALESVAEQSYEEKEIVVVSDNGEVSEFNEETRGVIASVKEQCPSANIVYIEHKLNRNGAAARNTGILASTGEYLTFLDDDDIYLQGRLKKSVDALRKAKKGVAGVYCGFLGWNSPANDLSRYVTENMVDLILLLDFKKHYLHTNTATYKASFVEAVNGFDESYPRHQDLEFNLRVLSQYKIDVCKEALVRLNPAPSSVSNKLFGLKLLDVKQKFLENFIGLLTDDLKPDVYRQHWEEVLRYIEDGDDVKDELGRRYWNGSIQVIKRL